MRVRTGVIAVTMAMALASSACSGPASGEGVGSSPSTTAPAPSGTTSTTPAGASPGAASSSAPAKGTPGQAATTPDAGQQRVLAANKALTTALYRLVNTTKKIHVDNTLAAGRHDVSVAAAGALTALKAERNAAYGTTTRSCGNVWAYYDRIRSSSASAAAANSRLSSRAALLRSDVSTQDAQVAEVKAALEHLKASLEGVTRPPVTIQAQEVTAALQAAADLRASTLKAASEAQSVSAKVVAGAAQRIGKGYQIAAKAC